MRKFWINFIGHASAKGRIIGVLALGLALLLGGCGALQLSYNEAPRLVYWWADGYVDFTDEQTPQVRKAVRDWFDWHRRNELPEIADLLVEVRTELQKPVTAEQSCRWYSLLQGRMVSEMDWEVPDLARLALTLQPAQFQHIAERFDKSNRELREERIEAGPQTRQQDDVRRWRNRYRFFYGDLNAAQLQVLNVAAQTLSPEPALMAEEWRYRQQDILDTLKLLTAKQPPEAAQAALRALLGRLANSPRPAWQQAQRLGRQGHCALFAELHRLATPTQLDKAQRRLQGWEDDVRRLVAEAGN